MPVPRRFRRRLLLPPGWVALGFLLLLGCLLLQAHWRQLQLPNVLRLMMLPLKQGTGINAWYFGSYSANPHDSPFSPVARLNKLRPWHSIDLSGRLMTDSFGIKAVESAVRTIQADSSHAGGVRVRFLPGATYADLITTLDIMEFTNQHMYWLDIRHHPTTLYALTRKMMRDTIPTFICSCCPDYSTPPPISFWQQWLTNYWLPAWRLPLLLILAMGALSSYRFGKMTKSQLGQPKQ